MDYKHENLFFHTSFLWLSKVNMLAGAYETKDELILFLEAHGKQNLLLSIKSKEFRLTLVNLVDIFEALND